MITEVTTEIIDVQDKNYVIAAINDITLLRETEKWLLAHLLKARIANEQEWPKKYMIALGKPDGGKP